MPLPADDVRVVEGVDEHESVGVAQLLHPGERVAHVLAVQDDRGPIGRRCGGLGS